MKTLLAFACALLITSASAITISTQPKAITVNAGSTAAFSVTTTNGTATGYQWFLGTTALSDGTNASGAIISGSQTAALIIENVPMNMNAGLFKVVISTGATPLTSVAVRLTVKQGTLIQFNLGDMGTIVLELFDHDKPVTVQNFLRYALGGPNRGGYLNSFFTRLEPGFVLQGGGFAPIATGAADSFTNEASIPYDVFRNNYTNRPAVPWTIINESHIGPRVRNTFGTIAMATVNGDPNTAQSEFFFNLGDNSGAPHNLDEGNGGYTVFGRVTQGLNVLTNFNNLPSNQILSYTVNDTRSGTNHFPTLPTRSSDPNNVKVSDLYFTSIGVASTTTIDLIRPTARFVYPLANTKVIVTNSHIIMRGTATDNVGVSGILCVDAFHYATGPDLMLFDHHNGVTVRGTTNWTAEADYFLPGPWHVAFRIFDGYGNWTEIQESFVVTDRLTVRTNGIGRIIPSLNGQDLAPESTYKMTAVPGPGQLFAYWSGDRSGTPWNFPYGNWSYVNQVTNGHTNLVLTGPALGERITTPTLSFIMHTNLTITANFVSNYFPVVQGTYYGLIAPTDHNDITVTNAGLCKIVSSAVGSFSGTMSVQGKVWPFAGKWDYAGNSTVTIRRTGMSNLVAQLNIDLSNNLRKITGTVSAPDWTSDINAYRSVTKLSTNTTPAARNFVVKIPSQNSDLGDSIGTLTVTATGLLNFTGTMADNTTWTESVGVDKDGNLPIFCSLYGGRGLLIGLQQFQSPTNSIGATRWHRPAISNAFYTNGFSTPAFYGYIDAFVKPTTGSTYNLRFGGNTLPEVSFGLQAASTGQLLVTSGPTNRPRLTLTVTTGALNGTWVDSNKGVWTLKGIFQSPTAGGTGFIIGPHGQTGYLHIDPL